MPYYHQVKEEFHCTNLSETQERNKKVHIQFSLPSVCEETPPSEPAKAGDTTTTTNWHNDRRHNDSHNDCPNHKPPQRLSQKRPPLRPQQLYHKNHYYNDHHNNDHWNNHHNNVTYNETLLSKMQENGISSAEMILEGIEAMNTSSLADLQLKVTVAVLRGTKK